MASIQLSVCIATYNRARFIGETLRSILDQLAPGVEVVVVDGASPDDTAAAVAGCAHPALRYFRQPVNSGVDADFDAAVGRAEGEYCWLMSDDDLLAPGAIARVLAALADRPDLVVVNAETRTLDLMRVVDRQMKTCATDRTFGAAETEALFVETAGLLSFIGATVIRRALWQSRERTRYYGSLFIHVGVIFQAPIGAARLVCEPLVRVRLGNSLWGPKSLEVWMFKWPQLIWSLSQLSEDARAKVCPREPWRNLRMLGFYRAMGAYSMAEYRARLADRGGGAYRTLARAIARVPPALANTLAALYIVAVASQWRGMLFDLASAPSSTPLARWGARRAGILA
jgi:hypothetical protein